MSNYNKLIEALEEILAISSMSFRTPSERVDDMIQIMNVTRDIIADTNKET